MMIIPAREKCTARSIGSAGIMGSVFTRTANQAVMESAELTTKITTRAVAAAPTAAAALITAAVPAIVAVVPAVAGKERRERRADHSGGLIFFEYMFKNRIFSVIGDTEYVV